MPRVRRAAVLVGAPALKGSSYLPGVDSDMEGLASFLLGNSGGDWDADEIHTLKNPKKAELLGLLAQLEKTAEYFFFAYGGHGHHIKPANETSLCINDTEEILVREIFPTIPRQVLLIDSCRKLTTILEMRSKSAVLALSASRSTYGDTCRVLFDNAINNAERGRVVMYSCSPDEAANDGLFTPALVNSSRTWADANCNNYRAQSIRTIPAAFADAKEITIRTNRLQNPVLHNERRLGEFPFAVA